MIRLIVVNIDSIIIFIIMIHFIKNPGRGGIPASDIMFIIKIFLSDRLRLVIELAEDSLKNLRKIKVAAVIKE
jgi:hypothetical protein